jgi:hypothetical protein
VTAGGVSRSGSKVRTIDEDEREEARRRQRGSSDGRGRRGGEKERGGGGGGGGKSVREDSIEDTDEDDEEVALRAPIHKILAMVRQGEARRGVMLMCHGLPLLHVGLLDLSLLTQNHKPLVTVSSRMELSPSPHASASTEHRGKQRKKWTADEEIA